MTRLQGKMAIVTGGGTGIGRAIALAFAREGAKVAVLGRRDNVLDQVVKEIAREGVEAKALVSDVA